MSAVPAAGHATTHDISPESDILASADFRRHLAKTLTERALTQAHDRAMGGSEAVASG